MVAKWLASARFGIRLLPVVVAAQVAWADRMGPSVDFNHGNLKVTQNGHLLQHADGTPFFYMACTAWELFHRLSREDADKYLENRRAKGFTVIQAVALAELDGLSVGNAYGHKPLIDNDPNRPVEAYFQHVDYIVDKAAEKGLFIGFLPTWGDKVNLKWGPGPTIFNTANARTYGKFLGTRYKDKKNIIWILGGDRDPADAYQEEIWRSLAGGLAEGDGGKFLMTYHPLKGDFSSSAWFHNDSWLDFNMFQSGHNGWNQANYDLIIDDYNRSPAKPVLDGEPNYEDHGMWDNANGWFRDHDVRKAAYWAVFAGGFGHAYGHHAIWQMASPENPPIGSPKLADRYWTEALDRPGGSHMAYLRNLMESRPFLTRVPDRSILASGARSGGEHMEATRGSDGSYLMIYLPNSNQKVTVAMNTITGTNVKGWWYNPRTGSAQAITENLTNTGTKQFTSPANGPDWVLVLDDASRKFKTPGDYSNAATALSSPREPQKAFAVPQNPGGRTVLRFPGLTKSSHALTVTGLGGRMVVSATVQGGQAVLPGRLPPGLYFLNVRDQGSNRIHKLHILR